MLSDDYGRFLNPVIPKSAGWPGRAEFRWATSTMKQATRKTFPEVDGQRVVISGDRASVEPDGTLRLFGRDSLVVNTGGEKVFVEEVEEVLRAHPGVADAVVVGRPSERWGEEIVAVVALHHDSGDVDARRLDAHVHRAPRQVQGAQAIHLRRADPSPRQRQGGLPLGQEAWQHSRRRLA